MSGDPQDRETWRQTFSSLAGALGDVARAETAVLREDVRSWGKRFGIAVALFGVAFMTLFWLVVLLLYAAVRGAESLFELGPAQAALAVAGVVLLLIVILLAIGVVLLRSVSGPMAAVKARWEDHRRWWREQVVGEPAETVAADRADA